jgi:hypothetical protein
VPVEGSSAQEGKVFVFDGVAASCRGDTILICYQKAARFERTHWLFDRIDDFMRALPAGGVIALMVVLETADPPDALTRAENNKRLTRLGDAVRCLVTVPVGDAFRMAIVRSFMRGLNLALGHSKTRLVSDTVEAGLVRMLEAASPATPSRAQIARDLGALYRALGVIPPELRFGATARTTVAPPR